MTSQPSEPEKARYHSLCVDEEQLPEALEAMAWTDGDRRLMALRRRDRPWFGLQFHPESVLTPRRRELLAAMGRWLRREAAGFEGTTEVRNPSRRLAKPSKFA